MVNFGHVSVEKSKMALEMQQVTIRMDTTVNTKERERGSATFNARV